MLLVFGSINLDLCFRCANLPGPGETVLAGGMAVAPGGKGANQAHAAQRYGVPTQLVGAVGDDAFAEPALRCLRASGVGLQALQRLPGATGLASVGVDARGENQILVAPGVNQALRHEHVPDTLLAQHRVLLMQMETDPGQNLALASRARRFGLATMLNNAPARTLAAELLAQLDVLIVNAVELAQSVAPLGIGPGDALDQLQELADRYRLTVLLTQGARGAVARAQGCTWHAPACRVEAQDTTGAGDTFSGVFAAARAEGRELEDALHRAGVAAALTCRLPDAQPAQPARDKIEAELTIYRAGLGLPECPAG